MQGWQFQTPMLHENPRDLCAIMLQSGMLLLNCIILGANKPDLHGKYIDEI